MKGYDIVFTNRSVRHEKRKRVPATTGIGFTHVADGHEQVYYCVSIDFRQLEAMAHKAARSKGQMCRDGALAVEVTSRRAI
jgi:hypothetical protein